MPDIDMESVGSRLSRSHDYGREHRDQGNKRLPHVVTAWAADRDGFSNQRNQMSAMFDSFLVRQILSVRQLKESAGREKNEERAKTWISKVKAAFLRDQAPDAERCLVFSNLLAGSERDWYNQPSRSTMTSWKGTPGRLYGHIWREE